ncbi:MAG TPA: hypothetical protein VFY49_16490 [Myxococcota bacterium]|nr:hypothetical protein [Myxococcota bacterium]
MSTRSTDRHAESQEARDIEIVVSMLRSLPEPEPSSDLTARVMQRVMEAEARPKLLRPAFGRFSDSRAAAVLAAGIACAAVGIGLQLLQTPAAVVANAPTRETPASGGRRVVPYFAGANRVAFASAFPDPRNASFFSPSPSEAAFQEFEVVDQPTASILDRRLDRQLNELQLDPQAFFHRLERVQERDRFVQRLAERAARRGDAAQVALNVRAVSHPLVRPMVEQLLHASLMRHVSE